MAGFDEGPPGEQPNYGWTRASVQYTSRRGYKPPVRMEDLVMPNGLGTARMLWACVLMAGMMTALYVWIPLWFLITFVPISGFTYGLTLGLAFLGILCLLYFGGARETRRDREIATRL
jgi:hypothetical protein